MSHEVKFLVRLSYFLLELEEKKLCLGIQDSKFRNQHTRLRIDNSGYSTKSGSKPKTKLNDSTRYCSGGVFYAKSVCHNY
jgi:hypothetical protein